MYKALIEIGGYNVGEEVPVEKAEIWAQMYKVSPVKMVEEEPEVSLKEENKVLDDQEIESKPEQKSNEFVLEDYLERNTRTVVSNIEKDPLTKEQLEKILKLENSGNKRKNVIKAINKRLGE
jgi:hypothetical protein